MLFIWIVCWVLLTWGLKDGDLQPVEVGVYGGLSILLLMGMLFVPGLGLWLVAPMALIDIVLVFKVLGGDVPAY